MVPPSKLDPGPFEVHFREQSQGLRSHAAAHPDLADTVTVHGVLLHPVCQKELYNPGLTPQRTVPDVRLGYASTGQSKILPGIGLLLATSGHSDAS